MRVCEFLKVLKSKHLSLTSYYYSKVAKPVNYDFKTLIHNQYKYIIDELRLDLNDLYASKEITLKPKKARS